MSKGTKRFPVALTLLVLSALRPAAPARGETRPAIDALMDQLASVHKFTETAISPDGTRVACAIPWWSRCMAALPGRGRRAGPVLLRRHAAGQSGVLRLITQFITQSSRQPGWGEAFTRANVKDFGYGDLRDILAGVGEAVSTLPIDPERIGLAGWSYGGYMVMWAVT